LQLVHLGFSDSKFAILGIDLQSELLNFGDEFLSLIVIPIDLCLCLILPGAVLLLDAFIFVPELCLDVFESLRDHGLVVHEHLIPAFPLFALVNPWLRLLLVPLLLVGHALVEVVLKFAHLAIKLVTLILESLL
jgi:hypothetical protein